MVAALGDFDVGGGLGRGEEAGRGFVVEIGGQQVRGALPIVAAEAALLLAEVALGTACVLMRSCLGLLAGTGFGGLARGQDIEHRYRGGGGGFEAAAARMASSSPVPTTASTSGILLRISSR